jgi:hypothetical protein
MSKTKTSKTSKPKSKPNTPKRGLRRDAVLRAVQLGWTCFPMMSRIFKRPGDKDRTLVIMISSPSAISTSWNVVAIDASLERFLDDHAHHTIGDFDDDRAAICAAESYARLWQKRAKATQAPECACGQIPLEPPPLEQLPEALREILFQRQPAKS